MTGHTLDYWMSIGGVLAAVATAIAALMAFKAVRSAERASNNSERSTRAQLMLSFDQHLKEFDQIHLNVRPGGNWRWDTDGPTSPAEWLQVEGYMGTYERMYFHYKNGDFDLRYIEAFHKYRLCNLLANVQIRQAKLVKEADQWKYFLELLNELSRHANNNTVCEYCFGTQLLNPMRTLCEMDIP